MIWGAILAAVLLAVAMAIAGGRDDDDEGGPGGLRRVRVPAAARRQPRSRR